MSPVRHRGPRAQIDWTGQGLVSENFTRRLSAANTALTTGQAQYNLVPLFADDVVVNICFVLNVAAAANTLIKVALYSKTGTLLAGSTDQQAAFQGGVVPRIVQAPLSSSVNVAADDVYYSAVLAVGGTMPTLMRSAAVASGSTVVGASPLPYGQQTGLSDLASPATIAATGNCFWTGVT